MPSIEEILKGFETHRAWESQGDEWSSAWGSPEMEWIGVILPRIQSFIPTETILEIGPGFGRWTQFLKDLCKKLIGVDLATNCIEHCRKRFTGEANLHFFINDGKTLNMVEENSIDFIFSFDSLVHVEMDVLDSYIKEFSRILSPNGVAFIHHSNMAFYQEKLPEEVLEIYARGTSVTYQKMIESCEENNLRCITQEIVNWGQSPEYLIDCFSLICKRNAYLDQPYKLYENRGFMVEAGALRRIYQGYSRAMKWKEQTHVNIEIDIATICHMLPCQEKEQSEKIIHNKDQFINDLLNSRSWKVTAPFRAIFRLLRTI